MIKYSLTIKLTELHTNDKHSLTYANIVLNIVLYLNAKLVTALRKGRCVPAERGIRKCISGEI